MATMIEQPSNSSPQAAAKCTSDQPEALSTHLERQEEKSEHSIPHSSSSPQQILSTGKQEAEREHDAMDTEDGNMRRREDFNTRNDEDRETNNCSSTDPPSVSSSASALEHQSMSAKASRTSFTCEHDPYLSDDDSSVESSFGSKSNFSSVIRTPYKVASSVTRRKHSKVISLSQPHKQYVIESGRILVRQKAGLFRKTIEERYWIQYGNNCLLFFKSKHDFEQWSSDRTLSVSERQKLIAETFDFERDSLSQEILGYKTTITYMKPYRRRGLLHLFKLFRWKSHGAVSIGSLSSSLAGSFLSEKLTEVQKLFDVVSIMIRSNPTNARLQHRILSTPLPYNMLNKIYKFQVMEYHDQFSDWLLQAKLEESGFIYPTRSKSISNPYDDTAPLTDCF